MTVELDKVVKNLKGATIKIDLFKDSPEDDNTANLFVQAGDKPEQSFTVGSLQDVTDCLRVYLLNYLS